MFLTHAFHRPPNVADADLNALEEFLSRTGVVLAKMAEGGARTPLLELTARSLMLLAERRQRLRGVIQCVRILQKMEAAARRPPPPPDPSS